MGPRSLLEQQAQLNLPTPGGVRLKVQSHSRASWKASTPENSLLTMALFKRNFGGNVNFAGYRGNNRVIQPRKNRDLFYNGASTLAVSMVAATAALLAF